MPLRDCCAWRPARCCRRPGETPFYTNPKSSFNVSPQEHDPASVAFPTLPRIRPTQTIQSTDPIHARNGCLERKMYVHHSYATRSQHTNGPVVLQYIPIHFRASSSSHIPDTSVGHVAHPTPRKGLDSGDSVNASGTTEPREAQLTLSRVGGTAAGPYLSERIVILGAQTALLGVHPRALGSVMGTEERSRRCWNAGYGCSVPRLH